MRNLVKSVGISIFCLFILKQANSTNVTSNSFNHITFLERKDFLFNTDSEIKKFKHNFFYFDTESYLTSDLELLPKSENIFEIIRNNTCPHLNLNDFSLTKSDFSTFSNQSQFANDMKYIAYSTLLGAAIGAFWALTISETPQESSRAFWGLTGIGLASGVFMVTGIIRW